jgi:uncharacterized protein YndB with AHSA1/START domain
VTNLIAKTTTLIRQPITDVFDAFVLPDKITRFWLASTTAPLAKGARVTWHFMVPGASEQVEVTQFDPPRLIAFNWSDGKRVALSFENFESGVTKVSAEVSGFESKSDIEHVVNATEGFTIVLCDLKVLLETGQSGNLVRDKAKLIAASRVASA